MITLLIPTMNRSEFLIRLLHYYSRLNFKHYITIGDSSSPEEFEKTNRFVITLKGTLNVEHYYYPGINNYAVADQLIQKVSTPYASFLPDDDFYIPSAIEKCMAFLDQHRDYGCARGKSIIFTLQDGGAHGQFSYMGRSNLAADYSIEEDKARGRLLHHAGNYSSVFAGVCRTVMFKKALRSASVLNELSKTKDTRRWAAEAFGELVTSFSLVVQDKVKTVDCLYWVRQHHDQRYLFPDKFDWITNPIWFPCYDVITRQITEDITEKEGVSIEEAKEIWKQAFWAYLNEALIAKYQKRYGIKKDFSRTNLLTRKMLRRILSMKENFLPTPCAVKTRPLRSEDISLKTLLNPSSLYYADFMPIYHAVTKEELNGKGLYESKRVIYNR